MLPFNNCDHLYYAVVIYYAERSYKVLAFRACNAKIYIDQKQVADSLLFKYFKPGQVVRYILGTVALPTRCSFGYVGNTPLSGRNLGLANQRGEECCDAIGYQSASY